MYSFGKYDLVTIGGDEKLVHIFLSSLSDHSGQVMLRKNANSWELLPDEELSKEVPVFHNHKKIHGKTVLEEGDIFWINRTDFV